jgi:hypothetical protein
MIALPCRPKAARAAVAVGRVALAGLLPVVDPATMRADLLREVPLLMAELVAHLRAVPVDLPQAVAVVVAVALLPSR